MFFSADSPASLRVDADCISPDVKNSIHVGDRILEINGTPIHNVPLDEVLLLKYFILLKICKLNCPVVEEGKVLTFIVELS